MLQVLCIKPRHSIWGRESFKNVLLSEKKLDNAVKILRFTVEIGFKQQSCMKIQECMLQHLNLRQQHTETHSFAICMKNEDGNVSKNFEYAAQS